MRHPLLLLPLFVTSAAACGAEKDAPLHPTWADVEPILRGACTHCHGGSAAQTGASGPLAYRFDFYDMTEATCGEAAQALSGQVLGQGWASLIKAAVTPPGSGWRPRMPPAPAEVLPDWQRETLVRWASEAVPPKGEPRRGNGRPEIQLGGESGVADTRLTFNAVISDPDGESVVGVLKIGEQILKMPRAGSFAATLDTSSWTAGAYPVTAVVCDGWDSVTYPLGAVQIAHSAANK